jgi:peroxiredoxin
VGAQGAVPEVGGHAPAFTLPDSTGVPRSLAGLAGRGRLALVFYRGDW